MGAIPAGMIASAAGGLISGGTKAILGAVQNAKANKALRNLGPDPGAQVAGSVKKATGRARNLAGAAFIDPRDVEASGARTAGILAEATRRGTGIDNVAGAYRMEQRDQARRFNRAANDFYTNNARYISQLNRQGAEEVRVQQYDQMRYMQAEQAIQAAKTAAQENIVGGIDMIGAGFLGGVGGAGTGAEASTMPTESGNLDSATKVAPVGSATASTGVNFARMAAGALMKNIDPNLLYQEGGVFHTSLMRD